MTSLKVAPTLKAFGARFSGKNLTQRAFLNASAAILDYGARVVVGLFVTPLLVGNLGAFAFGIWQIATRLTGYLSVAGGRPTQALRWTVATQQNSRDFDEKRRKVGSAVVVWLLFQPLMAAIGVVLVWYTPVWLSVPTEYTAMVRVAVAVLVANLMLVDLADVPYAILQGENLGYTRFGMSSLLTLTGGLLTAVVVSMGGGLVGAAAVMLLMTVVTGLFHLQIVRRCVGWFGAIIPSRQEVRAYFELSGWFLAWRLVQQGMLATDIVLLGLLHSPELVTIYTVTKFAPDALANLTVSTVLAVLPGLGGVINSGDMETAKRVRNLIMSVTWLLVTVSGAMTLLWGQTFVRLWVGPEYDAGLLATLLVTVMIAQLALIRNDSNLINLTLDLPHKVLVGVISVAVSLGLATVLVRVYDLGIVGLCAGFIAGRSILTVVYPWSLGRFLGCPLAGQVRGALRPVMVTAALYWLALQLQGLGEVDTWLELMVMGGLSLAAILAVTFYAGLTAEQRSRIWTRVQTAVQ